ncbi:Gfo/Idh/MocA family oxidoreductase, partial [Candidatus Bathyarchaeota archaeon]|nr:Gfo/Idh/MocA family oxidoreductase [Candidatus Bathyarchaeota archaeon]
MLRLTGEIGFGLIGCGNQGRLLGRCLKEVEGARVVAVADINEDSAKRGMEEIGGEKYYIDYHGLLRDGEVEAVIVAVPHSLLAEVSVDAAESGKHVFVEKPMGVNSREGREVVDACRKAGVKLMVGYCLRYDETVRKMKSLIDNGAVGEACLVTALRETPTARWAKWLFDPKMGGGILLYLGSHLIDEVLWIVGSEAERVYGELNLDPEYGIDETVSFTIRFKNRVLASLNLSARTIRRIHRVSVIGSEGTVISDPFQGVLEVHSRNAEEYSYPTLVKVGENLGRTYVL